MSEFYEKYGHPPGISEHIIPKILNETKNFKETLKYNPKGAEEQVQEEIERFRENKDFLGKAVEAAVDSALEIFSEKHIKKAIEACRKIYTCTTITREEAEKYLTLLSQLNREIIETLLKR